MSRWLDGIEEAAFKPGVGGTIFVSPHPWLFGRPRYYLVDAAQKATIGSYVRKRSQLALLSALVTCLIMVTVFLLLLNSGALLRIPPYLAGIVFAVLLVLPIVVVPHVYLMRMLSPIVKNLPSTDQRFTIGEQMSRGAKAIPPWLIYGGIGSGLLMMLGAALGMLELFLEGRAASRWVSQILIMTGGAFFVGYFVYLALLKKKAKVS